MSFHITLFPNPSQLNPHLPVVYRTERGCSSNHLSRIYYQKLYNYDAHHDAETTTSANQTANDRMLNAIFGKHVGEYQDVVETMRACPRDRFTDASHNAYALTPQPIGYEQTISAPYMHAETLCILHNFLRLARVTATKMGGPIPACDILDVGCGSGYLTVAMAILLQRCADHRSRVVGIDVVPELVNTTHMRLAEFKRLFPDINTVAKHQNGYECAREKCFNFIHVGATSRTMPIELFLQLRIGGLMMIPIRNNHICSYCARFRHHPHEKFCPCQQTRYEDTPSSFSTLYLIRRQACCFGMMEPIMPVSFVPLKPLPLPITARRTGKSEDFSKGRTHRRRGRRRRGRRSRRRPKVRSVTSF